jgi:hypothetical protein
MRTPSIARPVAGGRFVGESIQPVRHGARSPGALALTVLGSLALCALQGAWLFGCSKNNDGPRPTPIAPSPSAAAPAAATTQPAQPAAAPTPSAAVEATGPAATISGKITLASERKGDVTPNDAVYLVARRISDNPKARGSLVAVKRFTAASFPIEFTLGPGDMMFKNGAFEGNLSLAARVDKDGDPMTRRKGDVFGTVDVVKVGSAGVEVKLDQLQKEDESLAGGAPPMQGGLPPGHP